MQLRHELVRFDQTVWYRFRFRLKAPWPVLVNRTVIHQIKQNLTPSWETGGGGPCPPANPFFKIEAGGDGTAPAFVVKTRGTANCRDGASTRIVCGPWPLAPERWYAVNVMLRASQRIGGTKLETWLDGKPCPVFAGVLGYLDHGKRDDMSRPIADTQPRFGIYRDALKGVNQSIEFADIHFWSADPASSPLWAGLGKPD
jgi:hypothetical protein